MRNGMSLGAMRRSCAIAAALVMGSSAAMAADRTDWPGYRGPSGDSSVNPGVLGGDGAVTLKKVWAQKIGSGYSGIAVSGRTLVTMFSDGENDVAIGLDASDGTEKWRYSMDATYEGHDGSHTGPIATPLIYDGNAYLLTPRGKFMAVNAETGKEVWKVDLTEKHGAKKPHYGFSSSPIAAGGKVIVEIGAENATVAAFDPKTGEKIWTAGDDGVQYQSPIAFASEDFPEHVVASGNKTIYGIDPADGNVLWSLKHDGGGAKGAGSLTAVPVGGNRMLLMYTDDSSMVVELTKAGSGIEAKKVWEDSSIRNSYSVPVVHDGFIYGVSTRFLTCVDANTGEGKWRSREPGDGFPMMVDGSLVFATKEGGLHVAAASPDEYKERGSIPQLFEELIWSAPAFADGGIFVRSMNEIARVDVNAGGRVRERDSESEKVAKNTSFGRFVASLEKAADKQGEVDKYLASQKDFPIIDGDVAIFVYSGPAKDVAIIADFIGARQDRPLENVPGTNLWYYAAKLPRDARSNYAMYIDFKHSLDPRNDRKTETMIYKEEMEMNFRGPAVAFSWFTMPRFAESNHTAEAPKGSQGTLEEKMIKSELQAKAAENGPPRGEDAGDPAEFKYQLYLPAGYAGSSDRYSVLVFVGGNSALERGDFKNTLDNLIAEKKINPVIGVMLSRGVNTRAEDPIDEILAKELLPKIDEEYRTLASREDRAVCGAGFDGFGAWAIAMGQTDTFGKVGMISSLMFGAMETAAYEMMSSADPQKWVVFQSWGKYDLRNPHEAFDLAETNRKVHKDLKERGFKVLGGEQNDGTGWSAWRNQTDDMLIALFGK